MKRVVKIGCLSTSSMRTNYNYIGDSEYKRYEFQGFRFSMVI